MSQGRERYVGQVRFHGGGGWVDVSQGCTLSEAAAGAARAFRNEVNGDGHRPEQVRVVQARSALPVTDIASGWA